MTVGRGGGKAVVGALWLELVCQPQVRGVYGRHARRRTRIEPLARFVAKSSEVVEADGSAVSVFFPAAGAARPSYTRPLYFGLSFGLDRQRLVVAGGPPR